ncbi:3'-5' exonuclease [Kitasatospora sp. DSM 101779]|uniref:3'-5' exonuclease n=1 Tax=Kitasatospora sp. DSM 101779 TaxID=2853165 RepID=UPI0021D91D6B|nr:3'-5' exonuclease [Kitasatospora sp. DSM 101779]MCU7824144.1 3'-5' exonuclease [Kitasatospora sp. DSM 101779]
MGGYAVVDVEATGRSPWRHRIVEVAVVLLDEALRTEEAFATLIDPGGPVGPTHVHRITQDDVVGAPRFREVAPYLLDLLADRVMVGHHVTCDHAFLEREYARIGVPLPPVPLLCTMRMARTRLPAATGWGLTACAEAAGLDRFPAHTAMGDARAAADLLRHYARAGALPPADHSEPARDAAPAPWPRLGRARSLAGGELVPLQRREAPLGPWPQGPAGFGAGAPAGPGTAAAPQGGE